MRGQTVGIVLTLTFLLTLSSCTLPWRLVKYNFPGAKDHEIFPSREIKAGDFHRSLVDQVKPIPDPEEWAIGKRYETGDSPEDFFRKTGTLAFLVLRNDTLLHEFYAPEHDQESVFTTFSLAKVYISSLVGIAKQEGYIKGLDQPVADFLPEFDTPELRKIHIDHLLQMTSGLKSSESFVNPFNRITRMYYGTDLQRATRNLKLKHEPGTEFKYQNINTQILSRVLTKATGKPVAQYLEEKIWRPGGMEMDASWSLDHEGGEEKAFCCLNARARDFARFGLLFLDQGWCAGSQVVNSEWVCEATHIDTSMASPAMYQYNWYLSKEENDFFGQGLIGQFLYICPNTNTVIVRLGKKIDFTPWYAIFKIFAGLEYKPVAIDMEKEELKKFAGKYTFTKSLSGDESVIGKSIRIKVKKDHLKIKSAWRKGFRMFPETEWLFFNQKDSRKMLFNEDEHAVIHSIEWSRLGNSWSLERVE